MYGCEIYRKDCNEILKEYQNKVNAGQRNYAKRDLLLVRNAYKTLEIIENPLLNFNQYFQYVESLNLNQEEYRKLMRNKMFPIGGSIKAWIVTIFEFCQNGKIKDQEIVYKVFSIYQKVVMDQIDDLASSLMRLSFLLGYNDEQLAAFLHIKLFMLQKLKKRKEPLKERIFNKILEAEKEYDKNAFEDWQLLEIENFFLKLKKCDYEKRIHKEKKVSKKIEKSRVKQKEITFQNWLKINDVVELRAKCLEIKEYLKRNDVDRITNDVKFLDGTYMNPLLRKFIHFNNSASLDVPLEVKEYLSRELAEIIELFFKNKNNKLNKNSNLNYGLALDKVLFSFDISYIAFFEHTQIPMSVISGICRNEFFPSAELVMKIIALLNDLSFLPLDDYQSVILKEAKEIYGELYLEVYGKKNKEINSYVLYSKEKILIFEEKIQGVDLIILNSVKKNKFDWYLKWLTFYYICEVEERKPNKNEYFYDGTIIFKWIFTQKNTLDKNNYCLELSKDQMFLLDMLMEKVDELNYKKHNVDELKIIENFDSIINEYTERIKNGEDLLTTLNNDTSTIWNLLRKMIFMGNWFNDDQILKVKQLRNMAFVNHYGYNRMNGIKYEESFGFRLISLMDSFNISIVEFAKMVDCSVPSITSYRRNDAIPSVETIKKMKNVILQLRMQAINIDQQQEIIVFENFLNKVSYDKKTRTNGQDKNNYLQSFDKYFYGKTGNVYFDIEKGILTKVKENNVDWYNDFLIVWEALKNSDTSLYDGNKGYLNKFGWYLDAMRDLNHDKLSYEQIVLLKYLTITEEKNKFKFLKAKVKQRINEVEYFIDVNGRLPKNGEVELDDHIDAYLFYRDLRDKYWGFLPTRYRWFDDEMFVMTKKLLVKVNKLEYGLENKDDYKENNNYYIGNSLNYLRISLGFSNRVLPSILNLPREIVTKIYKNEIPLNLEYLTFLLKYFGDFTKNDLRRDQLVDIDNFYKFINTLNTRKNNELNLSLVYSPEEEN